MFFLPPIPGGMCWIIQGQPMGRGQITELKQAVSEVPKYLRNQKTIETPFNHIQWTALVEQKSYGFTLSKPMIWPSLHPGEDEISIHGGKILVQQHGVLLQIGFVTWNLGEKSWIRSGEIDDFWRKWMCFVKTNMFCRWLLGIPGCFWFQCPSSRQGYSHVNVKSAEFVSVCLQDFNVPSRPPFHKNWSHCHFTHLSERPWLTWKIRLSSHPTHQSFQLGWLLQATQDFLTLDNPVLANHISGLA